MQFGYYGKTIHRGDFVRFNLPQIFVSVLDDWLQTTLLEGETQHGESWKAVYANSNAYRFGLSAGIAGESAWIGVMQPSTDKVGRRFPFIMALGLPPGISPVTHGAALEPVYASIEAFTRDSMQTGFEFDSLQASMGEWSLSLQLGIPGKHIPAFKATDPGNALCVRVNSAEVLATPAYNGFAAGRGAATDLVQLQYMAGDRSRWRK